MGKIKQSYDIILDFPEQFRRGLNAAMLASGAKRPKRTKTILICGMGGSALPGDILASWKARGAAIGANILVHKNYRLPANIVPDETVVICISYSGNTEETVSAWDSANKKHIPTTVITSGGILAERARANRNFLIEIPAGTPPRFAVGYQFGALAGALARLGLLSVKDASRITKIGASIAPRTYKNAGTRIAARLANKIPVIYTSEANAALGYIMKIQLNENAKIPAFMHQFPELNHNEFNSYTRLSAKQSSLTRHLHVLMLEDAADASEIRTRMRVTSTFIKKSGVGVTTIQLNGNDFLTKLFRGISLGQWISVLLAERYGIDPLPTELIEKFKTSLR